MEDIQSLIWKQTRRIRKDSGEGEGEGEGNSRRGNSINKGSGLGGAESLEETEQFRFVEACDR